jgi:rRNA small subunit pseudouridine methyltransferase Nep1
MLLSKKRQILAKLTTQELDEDQKVYVILENCPLEHAKIGQEYKLLNSDDHRKFISKHGANPDHYRPDIVHQCLLTLMDSALNKAGRLQVFIHTQKNVCIEVNPQCRIPRTYRRFAGLMVQLLHKFKIVAATGTEQENKTDKASNRVLMKVVKNPIQSHLPLNSVKIALEESDDNDKLIRLENLVREKLMDNKNRSIVFVVGGFAHGELKDLEYVDQYVSISQYSLSASVVCGKICNAMEDYFDIF